MAEVTIIVDGKKIQAASGSLLQILLPDYRAPHVSFSHKIPSAVRAGDQAGAVIKPYRDDLFSSVAFGPYSVNLNSVLEQNLTLPYESEIEPE